VKFVVDRWDGNRNSPEQRTNPIWDDVEEFANLLDGRIHTQLCLERGDEAYILVGGGPDHFNVCVGIRTEEREQFFTLLNPSASPEARVELVTGGQLGAFTADTIVDGRAMRGAFRTFFASGEVDSSQQWRER
jgi:hypothetical protein